MQLFSDFTFDAEYLVRLRDRDDATWRHFIDYFYLRVRSQLKRNVSGANVTDLVQDVFLAALRGIDKGQPRDPEKLPGYVSGICRNLVHRSWDFDRGHPQVEMDLTLFSDIQVSIESSLMRQFNAAKIHRVLQQLLPRDREVIIRVVLNEEDRPSVAQRLGITEDGVKVLRCRALKRFRREWDKETEKEVNDKTSLKSPRELTFHD